MDENTVKTALSMLGNALVKKSKETYQAVKTHVRDEIGILTDPRVRFRKAVTTQYETLIKAGLDEHQAHEMAVKMVEDEITRVRKSEKEAR